MLKAQDILYELISCLNENQGGEIARNLKQIYLYCIQQLTQANLQKDPKHLDEVEGLVQQLRSAWVEIGKDVGLGARI
jgi:flagellar protein FliS